MISVTREPPISGYHKLPEGGQGGGIDHFPIG